MMGKRYLCYVLRLWQASAQPASSWRASLEDVHSGERLGFRGLTDLTDYLERKTVSVDSVPGSRDNQRMGRAPR